MEEDLNDNAIQTLIEAKNIDRLVRFCEELEKQTAIQNSIHPYYAIHLVCYLILNDLNSARFLWKRIPNIVKEENEQLRTLWSIGIAMWEQNYENVYCKIDSYTWTNTVQALLTTLLENFRQRTLRLLSCAYSCLRLRELASFMGMSLNDALEVVGENRWKFDKSKHLVYPSPIKDGKACSIGAENVHKLCDYVLYLEK